MKSSRSSAESTSKTESGVAYAQGDENRLCGLLEDLRRVRAVGARPGLQQPSLQVLEKAKELNRVRYCPGNARFLEGRRALRSSSIRKGCGNDYLESMRYFRIEGLLDGVLGDKTSVKRWPSYGLCHNIGNDVVWNGDQTSFHRPLQDVHNACTCVGSQQREVGVHT